MAVSYREFIGLRETGQRSCAGHMKHRKNWSSDVVEETHFTDTGIPQRACISKTSKDLYSANRT